MQSLATAMYLWGTSTPYLGITAVQDGKVNFGLSPEIHSHLALPKSFDSSFVYTLVLFFLAPNIWV